MIGLQIELEEIEGVLVLRLEGRLDVATSPLLDRKIDSLIEEKHLMIALDFSDISYLSSSGMRVLLSKTKRLQSKKGILALFSISSEVEEILKIAGFERILTIFPSEKEMLQTLHPQ